jgi:hypothetical protein
VAPHPKRAIAEQRLAKELDDDRRRLDPELTLIGSQTRDGPVSPDDQRERARRHITDDVRGGRRLGAEEVC